MTGCVRPWAGTGAITCGRTTAGTSCWENTRGSSPRFGTPADRLQPVLNNLRVFVLVADSGGHRLPAAAVSGAVAVRGAAPPRTDLVAFDHLVQRRRLDMEELSGFLLHAAGRFERRFDQLLLEVGDDVLERDALRRHDELRHREVR